MNFKHDSILIIIIKYWICYLCYTKYLNSLFYRNGKELLIKRLDAGRVLLVAIVLLVHDAKFSRK